MSNKGILFKGTRDISGDDMRWRQSVLDTIRETFELFGFEPLETPVIERKETLLGKYGEEAENLLFMLGEPHADGGLRYDHTVPLARFAASNWQDLNKPYKRYAIGPVFRAENVQKGRGRQFYQCDFDTVGSDSPTVDAEIVAINYTVFSKLGFSDQYVVELNDRRLLNAMVSEMGFGDQDVAIKILRAWDKLDKNTPQQVFEYVERELAKHGIDKSQVEQSYGKTTEYLYSIKDKDSQEIITLLKEKFTSKEVITALVSIEALIDQIKSLGVPEDRFHFNPLLARGLSYYTGPIFETIVKEGGVGSLSGGGRYDSLIANMGGPSVAASGSAFGLDRLLEVMGDLNLRPGNSQTTKVFVSIFDQNNKESTQISLSIARQLREAGIATEIWSGGEAKIGKQLELAVKKNILFLVVVGPNEASENKVNLKNLNTREEQKVELDKVVETVTSGLN